MQHQFKAISLSHKNASLEVRELLSLSEQACHDLLHKVRDITTTSEALVVSTCNRTEIYYSSDVDYSETLIKLLALEAGITDLSKFSPYFEKITNHKKAAKHLFHVAIGLESQVIGDLQITNQLKRAYQRSADLNLAGPILHRLMHTIFFTNKKVVQETAFRDGAASVSYAAVELIEELVYGQNNPKVLVLGLGEIGADVVRNLKNTEIADVVITNRTHEKAAELADEFGYKAVPFEQAWEQVERADIIVSAIAAQDGAFFTKEEVAKLNLLSYKIFIDLSVPRSVDESIEEVVGAIVYNIDDVNVRASKAIESRKQAIPAVKGLIDEALHDFDEWVHENSFAPAIQKFKDALELIRNEEISKHLKQLDNVEAEKVEMITRSIMNKIIKLPVLQLKAACRRGDAENLAETLNDLFNIELSQKAEK
ncbi:glutamyl-tRNA reductase [Flammeovirgaceae bacterium SG7u.111]|nr:glutamyl-tRNA reductase [Flammeovirgaceae bacterium SG7u.132]WPO35272.1 glutamyl-tRNA reductase [Flammeovirgaceae bacterium SG7u.111]